MIGLLFSAVFLMISLTIRIAIFTLRLVFMILALVIQGIVALAHSRR